MFRARRLSAATAALSLLAAVVFSGLLSPDRAAAQVDPRPRDGLSSAQLADFYAGLALFKKVWPLSTSGRNEDQCSDCHFRPGIGGSGHSYHGNVFYGFTYNRPSREIGIYRAWPENRVDGKVINPQVHFRGEADGTAVQIPSWTNAISRRIPRSIFGIGSIAQIPQSVINAHADPFDADGDGVSGRIFGRYGTQGQWSTLQAILEQVIVDEVGVAEENVQREDVRLLIAFISYLRDPRDPTPTTNNLWGEATFVNAGCADCHVQRYTLPNGRLIKPYSDFLVHDMGPCLDDGVSISNADSWEWRTTPLWGLNDRGSLILHDGRGGRIEQSIAFHCGEAASARERFYALPAKERDIMLGWLAEMRTEP
jgi:CxxC motif-containing protein (DUF1111 family)